jgi:hypothetical protein
MPNLMLSMNPHLKIPIHSIREESVILDSELAKLYGVETSSFNQTIARNLKRFPKDFSFVLNRQEFMSFITPTVIKKTGRGGRTRPPRVFTEHGALMAATLLNSERAVAMSVYVIRAFVRMRQAVLSNQTILKRLAEIDKDLLLHDRALRDVYQKLLPLLQPPPVPPKPRIGF